VPVHIDYGVDHRSHAVCRFQLAVREHLIVAGFADLLWNGYFVFQRDALNRIEAPIVFAERTLAIPADRVYSFVLIGGVIVSKVGDHLPQVTVVVVGNFFVGCWHGDAPFHVIFGAVQGSSAVARGFPLLLLGGLGRALLSLCELPLLRFYFAVDSGHVVSSLKMPVNTYSLKYSETSLSIISVTVVSSSTPEFYSAASTPLLSPRRIYRPSVAFGVSTPTVDGRAALRSDPYYSDR